MLDNIFKKILVIVIVIFIIHFFFFNFVLAQGDASVKFAPQIGIPGTEFQKGAEIPIPDTTAKIGEYIKGFYVFIISALAILSVVMIAWAGITWLTAGGSAEKVGAAKANILGALGGLALGLLSYVILQTINPDLVNFRITTVEVVKREGCCQYAAKLCDYKSQESCKEEGGIWKDNCTCSSDGKCGIALEKGGCCTYNYFSQYTNKWELGCTDEGETSCLNLTKGANKDKFSNVNFYENQKCAQFTNCPQAVSTKKEGDNCEALKGHCSAAAPNCINIDGYVSKCYDGSLGDRCNQGGQCLSQHCAKIEGIIYAGYCSDGKIGSYCYSNQDCEGSYKCLCGDNTYPDITDPFCDDDKVGMCQS